MDGGSPFCPAIAGPGLNSPGASLHIEDSTIIGRVWAQAIRLASNSIFWAKLAKRDPWQAPVLAQRTQVGCIRFSWLPANSITPRKYECLPADSASQPALEPKFISLHFGNPGYGLLSGDVPIAIWKGADNGSQMGAFSQIQETEAITNIQIRYAENLPANLESGVMLIPSRTGGEPLPTMLSGYGIHPPAASCHCADENAEEELPFGIGIGLM